MVVPVVGFKPDKALVVFPNVDDAVVGEKLLAPLFIHKHPETIAVKAIQPIVGANPQETLRVAKYTGDRVLRQAPGGVVVLKTQNFGCLHFCRKQSIQGKE